MPRTVEAWWSGLGWRDVCDIDGNSATMDVAEAKLSPIPAPQRPADASLAPESPESRAALVSTLRLAQQRANALADDCGTLRTENDALLRENAILRREVERLGRKKR